MKEWINDPQTLRAAAAGDDAAMERVVSSNLGLVKSCALRFLGRGCELEDLIQIGSIGMLKAIKGFDAEKNCRFTTYAVPLICGEIKRFLRDDGWIKISRDTKQNAVRIFRFSEEYEKQNGVQPTMEKIREQTGLTDEEIVFAMEAARPAFSLYEKDEETGFCPENLVGEDDTEKEISLLALQEGLAVLEKRERLLIDLRYFRHLTQEETARVLGETQVRISREEKKILQKLRTFLATG